MTKKDRHVAPKSKTVKVTENAIPLGGIISLLEIQEYGDYALFRTECILNIGIQAYQMVHSTTISAKSALDVGEKALGFQSPYQTIINHAFKGFTDATSK